MHIEYFFDEEYKDVKVTTDLLKKILKDSELLIFLEKKMRQEENHEGFEIDDDDLETEVDPDMGDFNDDMEGEEIELDEAEDEDFDAIE